MIDFYLKAETINRIHSPLLYSLITAACNMQKSYYADSRIEALRAELAQRKDSLTYIDYGAINTGKTKTIKISKLLSSAVSNKWKCKFLRNLVLYYQPQHLIEFGTNLGISSAYMRSAQQKSLFTTVEAAEELSTIAQANFKILCYTADFKTMTFDDFLFSHSKEIESCDFFYLDGDHSYAGTMRYFKTFWDAGPKEMLFVLDDINWSPDMRRAWEDIKTYADCYTVDFYKMGLVIKRPDIQSSLHKKIVPRLLKPWQFGFFG